MFCKKILSIVGLIFLGSQLSFAADDCAPTYGSGTCTATGCVEGDADKLILANGSADGDTNKYAVKITNTDGTVGCDLQTSMTDDYCISTTNEINTRIDGFCNADACVSQVTCTDGVCVDLAHSCTRDDTVLPTPCNPKTAPGECLAGYYILSGNDLLAAAGEGDLYHCTEKGSCGDGAVAAAQYPTGYLVNADPTAANIAAVPYIQCTKGGKCLGLDKTTITAENCNGDSVKAGDLIYVDAVGYNLCITKGTNTGVAINNNDKYFICYEESSANAFTGKIPDGFCGIVEMTATDITLKDYVGSTSTKYIYTNANQKIYLTSSDDICKAPNTITEFKLDYCSDKATTDATDYYIKGATTPGPIPAN